MRHPVLNLSSSHMRHASPVRAALPPTQASCPPPPPQALKSSTEEYNRILDVLYKYAVFKAGTGFMCKRQVRAGQAGWQAHRLDVREAGTGLVCSGILPGAMLLRI